MVQDYFQWHDLINLVMKLLKAILLRKPNNNMLFLKNFQTTTFENTITIWGFIHEKKRTYTTQKKYCSLVRLFSKKKTKKTTSEKNLKNLVQYSILTEICRKLITSMPARQTKFQQNNCGYAIYQLQYGEFSSNQDQNQRITIFLTKLKKYIKFHGS